MKPLIIAIFLFWCCVNHSPIFAQSGGVGTPPPPPNEHGSTTDQSTGMDGGGAPIAGGVFWLGAFALLYAGKNVCQSKYNKA